MKNITRKTDDKSPQKIAEKNDLYRNTFIGCKIVMTDGVSQNPDREKIITAVRAFNNFTPENDPLGEHDFAFFYVGKNKYYFKFDYFDDKYEFFIEDGRRVLTIGRVEDY